MKDVLPLATTVGAGPLAAATAATTRSDDPAGLGDLGLVLPTSPATLGRYRLRELLGRGGMGVVYAAEDRELQRSVALKLVQPGRGGAEAGARLLREARTLARITHPNVVAIHDVGEADGQLFLAMERIDGVTLRAWINAETRPWGELLALVVAAGRGLVAVHDAGLVHRDFKPENVLVDRRGVPRIVDFGLARLVAELDAAGGSTAEATANAAATTSRSDPADEPPTLTRTGAILGTPAYMAPEQHLGDPSDARADQFALCVVLWEALHGEHPFPGESAPALRDAVVHGRLRRPRRRVGPRSLRRIVARGLAPDPARRWPRLTDLLDALEAIPRRRRLARGGLALGAAGAALIAGTWGLTTAGSSEHPGLCAAASAPVVAAWDGSRRAAVARALTASAEGDEALAAEVSRRLDAYAAELAAALEEACAGVHGMDGLPPALAERRHVCLIDRVAALDATAAVFAGFKADDLPAITGLLAGLPAIDRCSDLASLEGQALPPLEEVARVATIKAALAGARVALIAGHHDVAEAALGRARRLREGLEHRGLDGALLGLEAALAGDTGELPRRLELGEEAYHAALAAGDDSAAILAALELADAYARKRHDLDRARAWARHAASLLERRDDPLVRVRLRETEARIAWERFEVDEALELYAWALARKRELVAGDSVALAETLGAYGTLLALADRPQAARAALEESLRIWAGHLGRFSRPMADAEFNLALLLATEADHAAALARVQSAQGIYRRLYGDVDLRIAQTQHALAMLHNAAGQPREALADAGAGLVVLEALDQAGTELEARLRAEAAAANLVLGDLAAAREGYAAALEILRANYGAGDPLTVVALLGLAGVELADGAATAAAARADEALELLQGEHVSPTERAQGHLLRGRARLALGDLEGAQIDAAAASSGFAGAGPTHADDREAAGALLRAVAAGGAEREVGVDSRH